VPETKPNINLSGRKCLPISGSTGRKGIGSRQSVLVIVPEWPCCHLVAAPLSLALESKGGHIEGRSYPAVRTDAECIGACVTGSTILHYGDCDNAGVVRPIIGYTIVPLCFVVDVPISVVTDTILIPLDLMTPTRQEEAGRRTQRRTARHYLAARERHVRCP